MADKTCLYIFSRIANIFYKVIDASHANLLKKANSMFSSSFRTVKCFLL